MDGWGWEVAGRIGRAGGAVLRWLTGAWRPRPRRRSGRLEDLPDPMLRDIGLTRHQLGRGSGAMDRWAGEGTAWHPGDRGHRR